MPGFTPYCPKCNSDHVELLGVHDHYAHRTDGSQLLDSTIFAYRCACGLAFTFEIPHGQKPASWQTGLRDSPVRSTGFSLDGDAGER